jgi:hypothetical protein
MDQEIQYLKEREVLSAQNERIIMLTALLAVALFILGITRIIHKVKLKFAIVLGTMLIAGFSIAFLFSVPVIAVSF